MTDKIIPCTIALSTQITRNCAYRCRMCTLTRSTSRWRKSSLTCASTWRRKASGLTSSPRELKAEDRTQQDREGGERREYPIPHQHTRYFTWDYFTYIIPQETRDEWSIISLVCRVAAVDARWFDSTCLMGALPHVCRQLIIRQHDVCFYLFISSSYCQSTSQILSNSMAPDASHKKLGRHSTRFVSHSETFTTILQVQWRAVLWRKHLE